MPLRAYSTKQALRTLTTTVQGMTTTSPSTTSPDAAPGTSHATTSDQGRRSGVVIVGGGPAGLSAALMIAHRGWTDITVLERHPTVLFTQPDK